MHLQHRANTQIILDNYFARTTLHLAPSPTRKRDSRVTTMNVQQAISDFLQHGQAERNLSDRTLRAYNSDLSQFHVHMNGVNGANMVDITPEHLEQYLDKLGTGPY